MLNDFTYLVAEIWGLLGVSALLGLSVGWILWGWRSRSKETVDQT